MSWKSKKKAVPDPSRGLLVKIQTPEGVVWEGAAQAVSSKNSAGPFDLLPQHANIITLIEGKPIAITTETETKEYRFEKAVISCQSNTVSIYADIVPGSGDSAGSISDSKNK